MSLTEIVTPYLPGLLSGFLMTLWLSAAVILVSTPLALLLALLRDSHNFWLRLPATLYVTIFRMVPALIVLFFAFYALPQLGLRLKPVTAAILGMVAVGAAYMSEDIRGGLQAIDRGQWKAARALGLSHAHTLRRIILPQALPLVVPPYMTRAIIMMKGTSLASMVAVGDLTAEAVRASSITYQPFIFIILAGAVYLAISAALVIFQHWAEARLKPAPMARRRL